MVDIIMILLCKIAGMFIDFMLVMSVGAIIISVHYVGRVGPDYEWKEPSDDRWCTWKYCGTCACIMPWLLVINQLWHSPGKYFAIRTAEYFTKLI